MTRLLTYNDDGDSTGGFTRSISGTVTDDTSIKYEGDDSRRFDTTGAYEQFQQTSTLARWYYAACLVRPLARVSTTQALIAVIDTAGGFVCRLIAQFDGTLRVVNGSGSFVGSPSPPLDLGRWNVIELGFQQQAAGNGSVAAWLNDIEIVAPTSAPLTNTAANRWRFGRPVNSATITSLHEDQAWINDDQGDAPDNTWPHPLPPPAKLRPSGDARRPVNPVGIMSVANHALKHADDRVGLRFVLDAPRVIDRIWVGFRLNGVDVDELGNPAPSEILSPEGYGAGNGGVIRTELFATNASGFPTGSAIASEDINAVQRYKEVKAAYVLPGLSGLYFILDTAELPAGEYIAQFRNVHATPASNFFSVNMVYTSGSAGGPHAVNTRTRFAAGAIAGLDPRECYMWSLDSGSSWMFGGQVGTDMVDDVDQRPGLSYYCGDDIKDTEPWNEIPIPWYGFIDDDGTADPIQPYYALNAPAGGISAPTVRYRQAGRDVIFTRAGGFPCPPSGDVGVITLENLTTSESATCDPAPGPAPQIADLSTPITVLAGQSYRLSATGSCALAAADYNQWVIFGLGNGQFPVNTDGQTVGYRAELFAL